MNLSQIKNTINNNDINEFKTELTQYLKVYKINDIFDDKMTLLDYAIFKDSLDIVDLLITKYKVNIPKETIKNACRKGNFNIIKILCKYGVIIKRKNVNILLTKENSFEIVQYIFTTQKFTQFNKKKVLTQISDDRLFSYLLEKGALITSDNVFDIFMNCCSNYNTSVLTVKNIIQKIKKITNYIDYYMNKLDCNDNSALHNICKCKNAAQIIPILIHNGANINKKNHSGNTPLLHACKHNIDLIDVFIENKADLNIVDKLGETVLFEIVKNPNFVDKYDMFDKLISAGANINIRNNKCETVFLKACLTLNINLVKYLVKKGADLHAIYYDQKTYDRKTIVNIISDNIHKYKNKNSQLVEMFKYFAENKCNMNSVIL